MFQKITRKNLEKFLKANASEKKTLDIGAGNSNYYRYFPNRTTIDIDEERKPDIIGDAHNLPFKDEKFETILCTEVLEHLIDPKKAISEMRRVLKKGGKIILTTRFVYPLHDAPFDYWRFTKYGLKELFKEWSDVEIIPETKTFSAIGVLLQRIFFQTKLKANKLTKLLLIILSKIFASSDFLIKKEFGDIKNSKIEHEIMPSGYYLTAIKK